MTEIALLNAYSARNIGDAAIYASYVRNLPEARFVCDLAAFHGEAPAGVEAGAPGGDCAAYLSVGGDIFNNARPRLITRRFLANLASLAKAPAERTFLFGQSIPPSCRGLAFAALSRTLRTLSSVHVRDARSHERLRAAGVRSHLGFDAAFGLRASARGELAAQALLAHAGVDPQRSAFISVRGASRLYATGSWDLPAKLARLAQRLDARGHRPVLLLQSRVDGEDDDVSLVHELVRHYPRAQVLDLTRAAGAEPWDSAAAALARAHIVVGVRFHTCVLRMLSGRSAYSLFYSNKGEDLVRRLGLPGASIGAFDPDAMLAEVERTAQLGFAIEPVRESVAHDLKSALARALGRPRPLKPPQPELRRAT